MLSEYCADHAIGDCSRRFDEWAEVARESGLDLDGGCATRVGACGAYGVVQVNTGFGGTTLYFASTGALVGAVVLDDSMRVGQPYGLIPDCRVVDLAGRCWILDVPQRLRPAVMAALEEIETEIAACGDGRSVAVMATLTFLPTGRVSCADVRGDGVSPAQSACITRAVRRVRVPAFDEPSFAFSHALRVSDPDGADPARGVPSREGVASAMAGVAPAVTACASGEHGTATVEIVVVGSTGRVTNAIVTGVFAGTPTGSCIARAVRGATFPRFGRATFGVVYPFRI